MELLWLGDMDIVDVRMPQVLELALNLTIFCGLTIIGIIIATPWFAIVMVPIIAGFLYIMLYFRRSCSRASTARWPHPFTPCVQCSSHGARAHYYPGIQQSGYLPSSEQVSGGVSHFLLTELNPRIGNSEYVDQNTTAFLAWYGINRWLAVRFVSIIAGY